jgi:hypothetical protein
VEGSALIDRVGVGKEGSSRECPYSPDSEYPVLADEPEYASLDRVVIRNNQESSSLIDLQ